jgi:hypothetical protein
VELQAQTLLPKAAGFFYDCLSGLPVKAGIEKSRNPRSGKGWDLGCGAFRNASHCVSSARHSWWSYKRDARPIMGLASFDGGSQAYLSCQFAGKLHQRHFNKSPFKLFGKYSSQWLGQYSSLDLNTQKKSLDNKITRVIFTI